MELKNKRVLVVGLARTGVATALFCAARGARVTATESRDEAAIGEPVAKAARSGRCAGTWRAWRRTFVEQDLIVPSPGVPADFPQLVAARKAGVKIWSEIELAYRFLQGSLVGITGSNGKTTTTALIEHILRGAGLPTMLAGNIGTPLISCRRSNEEKYGDGRGVEQLSTGIDRDVSPERRALSESDSRPSRSPSHVESLWRRESAHFRKSDGGRFRDHERGRCRGGRLRAVEAAVVLV